MLKVVLYLVSRNRGTPKITAAEHVYIYARMMMARMLSMF
jgi:hypothetical protein